MRRIFKLLRRCDGANWSNPSGRQNDFDLEHNCPWKGNQPSRRAVPPDIFVILTPRLRDL